LWHHEHDQEAALCNLELGQKSSMDNCLGNIPGSQYTLEGLVGWSLEIPIRAGCQHHQSGFIQTLTNALGERTAQKLHSVNWHTNFDFRTDKLRRPH
jgi:hypothetical protein